MMHKSVLEVARTLPQFSLEDLSLMKVITNLCNNPQMLRLILKCNFKTDLTARLSTRKGTEWEAVKAKANELVSQIVMSVVLQKRILELLWPICYRILLWKSIYAPYISNRFLKRFYWTDRGRIDNTRTVQCIIGNKSVAARKRFALACSVCLSQELHVMWGEMKPKDKRYFTKPNNDKISPLLLFWAYTLYGVSRRDDEFPLLRSNAVRCAVEVGLLEALKYFFAISRKATRKVLARREFSILFMKLFDRHLLEEDENDMGYFLFFEMSDIQQEIRFDQDTVLVLSLLLHSSEYTLCFRLLEERLGSFSEWYLTTMLQMIFYTYHLEVVGDDACRELFVDVWRRLPYSTRNYINDSYETAHIFCVLMKDNFPFLLEKRAFRKKNDFPSLERPGTFVNGADFHKWKFLQFLIQEEVMTISSLKRYRRSLLSLLEVQENTRSIWAGVLRFIRHVASKSPNQNE